jgi:hypothetical protein
MPPRRLGAYPASSEEACQALTGQLQPLARPIFSDILWRLREVLIMTMKSIETAALRLPTEARGKLAAALISSLESESPEEIERMWLDEADRRYRDYIAGRTKSVPSQDAFAAARRALHS